MYLYNSFLIYCRELAPGTVSLTGDRAQVDDNKHDSHYTMDYPKFIVSNWKEESISIQMKQ